MSTSTSTQPARLGLYELGPLIGRGGMAEVFLARATSGPLVGKRLAVKRLLAELADQPALVELFKAEADVTRSLRHPAIVRVHERGLHDGVHYFVMDFVEGFDLGRILAAGQSHRTLMPIGLACYVAHVVAQALDHAHRACTPEGRAMGIVHCDVTPANVFVARTGQVYLGDFGVAQSEAGAARGASFVGGKVSYFAPEQLLGRPVSPATDVFAVGALLYEMLTHERPFAAETTEAMMERIVAGDYTRPVQRRPAITEALEFVVARCLAAERSGDADGGLLRAVSSRLGRRRLVRYDSAAELASALATLYDPQVGKQASVAAFLRGLFGGDEPSF